MIKPTVLDFLVTPMFTDVNKYIIYTHIYICMWVCAYLYTYIYIYNCIHMCVYIFILIYTTVAAADFPKTHIGEPGSNHRSVISGAGVVQEKNRVVKQHQSMGFMIFMGIIVVLT